MPNETPIVQSGEIITAHKDMVPVIVFRDEDFCLVANFLRYGCPSVQVVGSINKFSTSIDSDKIIAELEAVKRGSTIKCIAMKGETFCVRALTKYEGPSEGLAWVFLYTLTVSKTESP